MPTIYTAGKISIINSIKLNYQNLFMRMYQYRTRSLKTKQINRKLKQSFCEKPVIEYYHTFHDLLIILI